MASIRKGIKMTMAAEFVQRNPGCTKMAVAQFVGPNGSLRFGYAVVDRAISAGMITARLATAGNKYQLFPGDWNLAEIAF